MLNIWILQIPIVSKLCECVQALWILPWFKETIRQNSYIAVQKENICLSNIDAILTKFYHLWFDLVKRLIQKHIIDWLKSRYKLIHISKAIANYSDWNICLQA